MIKRPGIFIILIIVSIVLINTINLSCKKELSCEGCRQSNESPVAVAGPDQVIPLPIDSVSPDGTASSDPHGKIIEWLWKKNFKPCFFMIDKSNDSIL